MPTFGLIAEGPTDHAVLENILIGYFNDYDLSQYIRTLQPLRDATDAAGIMGGWTRVLEYCQSGLFRDAFGENDYLIIQIDTDRLFEKPFELNLDQSVEALVGQVIQKFEDLMNKAFGTDFFEIYRSRILFAVAVNEIECWLLPLYYSDKNAGATSTCLERLNRQLRKNNERPITEKKYGRYDDLSGRFCKPQHLSAASEKNPSFKIFVDKLQATFSTEKK